MAALKTLTPSRPWIVFFFLAVQFALLIAAIVTVAVNKSMIQRGDTSATLSEGITGVVVAYEICWSIPLIITIGEMIFLLSHKQYPPGMYLLSNVVKNIFAVAGLIICVTRAHHGIAIVVVVGLIIVLFLPPIIYGSVIYYRARHQGKSASTNHALYDKGSADVILAGRTMDDKSSHVDQS